MPPCLCILKKNTTVSAKIENNTFGPRCLGCISCLFSFLPTVLLHVQTYCRDSGWRSVFNTEWPAMMRGPGLGSKRFARVPLGHLKQKTDRSGNAEEASAGIQVNSRFTQGLSRCRSEWLRFSQLQRGLSQPVQSPLRRMYHSLESQLANQQNSVHRGSQTPCKVINCTYIHVLCSVA